MYIPVVLTTQTTHRSMVFSSPIEPVYYLLPFIGLMVGLFGSMVGGGGGLIFLPVLVLLLNIPAHIALITSLVATLPISIAGSIGHFRKGNVNLRIAWMFAVAGILGAVSGAFLANQFSENGLMDGFGIYCIIIGLYIIVTTRNLRFLVDGMSPPVIKEKKNILKTSVFGFSAGVITGAFGTSGAAPLMAGLFSMSLPVKLVIGTSLLIVASNTFFAVGSHFLVGQVDLTLVLFLTSGSVIGALIGPMLLSRIKTDRSELWIRYLFAIGMCILGVLMIYG